MSFKNNDYSATSPMATENANSPQRLQDELNVLLNEAQNGGKRRSKKDKKQRGGDLADTSDASIKQEFNALMAELKSTGTDLPAALLEGGRRRKSSKKDKKGSKKLMDLEGGRRRKSSKKDKKGSKKLMDLEGGKRRKSSKKDKKGSKKLMEFDLEGGKRRKSSKKHSRKQSRELPPALVAFQKLVKAIVEGLNVTGVRKFAFKLAAEYKKMANGDTEEAIKLFNKEKASGKAKERYDAIAK